MSVIINLISVVDQLGWQLIGMILNMWVQLWNKIEYFQVVLHIKVMGN